MHDIVCAKCGRTYSARRGDSRYCSGRCRVAAHRNPAAQVYPGGKRPFVNYRQYIDSPEWRAKADAAKQRAGHRCQVCNRHRSEVKLNAHHRTYERLGRELPEDLTVLCRGCHELYETNRKLTTRLPKENTPKAVWDDAGPPPWVNDELPLPFEASRKIVVNVQATDDMAQTERRIRRVRGIVRSYPGQDIFEMNIHVDGSVPYRMKFPQETTGYCDALERVLVGMLGHNAVQIIP